jgi:hypothetical protein
MGSSRLTWYTPNLMYGYLRPVTFAGKLSFVGRSGHYKKWKF